MESKFFAFMSRMRFIDRWSLMRNTFRENNAEHSLMTAFIAHGLAVIENEKFGGSFDACKIGMIGAYHEASEVITGDMPTPIKYFSPEMRDAYKSVESVARETILSTLPEEFRSEYDGIINATPEEYRLVKYADKLTAYIKCVEETANGNSEFKKAAKSIEKELRAYKSKSVDYFLDTFVPPFALTLDDLSK
jgi:metal dependent phosphohydrolase